MSKADFDLFCEYFSEKSGIKFHESKRKYVENRLLERMAVRNMDSPADFLRLLKYDPEGPVELNKLFSVLPINETYFFRNPPQLKMFGLLVRTEFISSPKLQTRPLRIWCAGCSNGAEIYSLAMIVENVKRTFRTTWDHRLLGTDISTRMLLAARKGEYRPEQVRQFPDEFKPVFKQFTRPAPDGTVTVTDELRAKTDFTFHNLAAELPPPGAYDFVFCRNVLIYFEPETRAGVLDKLMNSLAVGGYLFLGHSEALPRIDGKFVKVTNEEAYGYKKLA